MLEFEWEYKLATWTVVLLASNLDKWRENNLVKLREKRMAILKACCLEDALALEKGLMLDKVEVNMLVLLVAAARVSYSEYILEPTRAEWKAKMTVVWKGLCTEI